MLGLKGKLKTMKIEAMEFPGVSRVTRVGRWAQPITFLNIHECDTFTDGQDGSHVDCGSSALCSNCATHGNLRGYFAVKSNDFFIYLKEFDVLLKEECILDQPERVNGYVDSDRRLRYHPEDLDVFNLENLLYNRGDEAYANLEPMPNPVERTFTPQPLPSWVVLSPMMDITCLLLELLVIVMASSSLQCQDSYGLDFADNGYSLIYADLVTEYVEMTVGEDTAYY
ncbi:hypothetical protein F2Q69_00063508 [Brassica cretica]|uniref:Uncharacterized protein n=1 Tax=Brassica cretica TaxID=69181 RepID=A0A8S9RR55_BRACR|nr:hypothetical protein F2Q69_00063508 [Brassica cretica]